MSVELLHLAAGRRSSRALCGARVTKRELLRPSQLTRDTRQRVCVACLKRWTFLLLSLV